MIQTIGIDVQCHIKYESNLGHKAIYNCAIPYLIALIMTSSEFSEDPKNEQINFWPERNLMTLNKMIINM